MSQIIQTTKAFNHGTNTATATFASSISSGNKIIVAVQAIDYAASSSSLSGTLAALYASISDSQGNTPSLLAAELYGTGGDNESILLALFEISAPSAAGEAVTFIFTPVSSAGNCQVGITCYEVNGLGNIATWNYSSPATGASFPLNAESTILGTTYLTGDGGFVVEVGACFTNDGAALTAGSGFTLDGAGAANLNSKTGAMATQSQLNAGGANLSSAFGGPANGDGSVGAALWAIIELTSPITSGGGGGDSVYKTARLRNACAPSDGLTVQIVATGEVEIISRSVALEDIGNGRAIGVE
jgi:hypothetical protein